MAFSCQKPRTICHNSANCNSMGQRPEFCCFSQGSSKSSLSYLDSVLEKLLEFPDLKPQETWGQGKRPEMTYTVSLWVTMEGPIACRSSQGNLSVPVKVPFERSPPAKHIRSSDIPPTGESQGRFVQGRKPQSLLTACSLHRSHHSQIPHPNAAPPECSQHEN